MNILFTTSKGISSKYVFHTICDVFEDLYERYSEHNIIFLTHYSSEKKLRNLFKKNNRKVFFDEVIFLNDYAKFDYTKSKNWLEIYDTMDISEVPKIDLIVEFGSVLSDGAYIQKGRIDYDKFFYSTAQFKYLSVRKLKEHMIFIMKHMNAGVPLKHYILDPQELDYSDIFKNLNYERYFPYTSETLNFTRDDAFLNTYKRDGFTLEKQYDFTFGYTILTKDRHNNFYDKLNEQLSNLKINLFLRDKYNDIDTFVTKNIYLEYIRKSRFTLIIPAYDKSTFSAYRYIESIYNGCVPLILDTNNLSEVSKSLYIPDEIIINEGNIRTSIETLDCEAILEKIKSNL